MKKILISLLYVFGMLLFTGNISAQYSLPIREMDIPIVKTGIVINGIGNESDYSPVQTMKIAKRAGTANPNGLEDGDAVDFNAIFKAAWDTNFLYVYVEITDDIEEAMPVGGSNSWTWDNFQVYIDLDTNSTTRTYNNTSTVELRFNRGDVGIETSGRADKKDYLYYQDNHVAFWTIEVGIPWTAASASGIVPDMVAEQAEGVIGFDIQVVDADGPGGGVEGGRNVPGGAQMFWDQDNPIDNADNAYQDRRTFGFARLVSIYNDTILCDSTETATISFDYPADTVLIYTWHTDGGFLLDSDFNSCNIKWNEPGEKNVQLIITKKSGNIDTLERKVMVYSKISVSLGDDFLICKNAEFTLNSTLINGVDPMKYYWNNQPGSSIYTGNLSQSKQITLVAETEAGCIATDEVFITVSENYYLTSICMVTVDAISNKNKIIWQKSGDGNVKNYRIYKESAIIGEYTIIDTVPATNESVYIDTTSQPSRNADRYAIMVGDNCNNDTYLSEPHQSMHLQLSLGAAGICNLNWSSYVGFSYGSYFIYKGSSINTLEKIDEIAITKTQYSDTSSGVSYYQIAVPRECNTSSIKSTQEIYTEARSNVVSTLSSVVTESELDMQIHVYPNPCGNEFVVEFNNEKIQPVSIEVFNMLGMKVYEYLNLTETPGVVRHVIQTNELNASEVLLLKVGLNDRQYTTRILKNL